MNRLPSLFLILLLLFTGVAPAKSQNTPAATPSPTPQKFTPPTLLPEDLVRFFSGEWTGTGEFANGKKIEADVSFMSDLDNQWLIYHHTDHAPNQYKALGTWGFESLSKTFIMVLHDNFGGVRLFSSEGWHDGKIVFVKSDVVSPKTGTGNASLNFHERFSFERQSDSTFKMTYEVSKDGSKWQMGDYLVFTKKT